MTTAEPQHAQPIEPQPWPSTHAIVRAKDPWHADAFVGTPAEGAVQSDKPRGEVWLMEDAWGNAIGVLTADAPDSAAIPLWQGGVWVWAW